MSQIAPQLAVFAMFLLALGPQASFYWQCEGQRCGVTSWQCCCASPGEGQNAECGEARQHFVGAQHADETGFCAQDCHCSIVVQEAGPSQGSSAFSFAAPLLFVAPRVFAPTFETRPPAEISRPTSSRGPPPGAIFLTQAPHRGPPVS